MDGASRSGVGASRSSFTALRSPRNWGIGDFSDLKQLAQLAARHGADFVGVNPLHALYAAEPRRYSPYSPSSREFLNVLYIDPEAMQALAISPAARAHIAEPAFQERLRRCATRCSSIMKPWRCSSAKSSA